MCDRGTFSTSDMGLDGDTPADRAGIQINGNNMWKIIIENASRNILQFESDI